ncbi:allantoinase PuuE [Thalassobaculum sp.]|uniref:allantoinase PuuE n=1 Tax=Thalassobaculum sp. TaxID=2022740 RepID=UPI003B58C765
MSSTTGGDPNLQPHLDRDMVGYGRTPPHANWPGGARLAINFVMNYEEGSEYSIPDGDGFSESSLTDSPDSPNGPGSRDLAAESMYEYGTRVGFWRLHRLFTERNLPLTVNACALALERNDEAAAAIRESGWDICCHGWRWVNHFQLSEAEEREHIARAVESLERTTGAKPAGWYCRHGPSVHTRRLVVEHGCFLYDSDSYADELPYWTEVAGQPHLVVPYSLATNDSKFSRNHFPTGDDYFRFVKDAIDMLWEEGATSPRMMSCGLHLRLIGHPSRAAGLAKLLDYVQEKGGIWVTRRQEIAEHWVREHPHA